MAMIDRLVKNAFNKEGFETLLNFSQKHLSEGAFDVMQKGFRGEEDYIFNAKVIKKALKKNDILETGDMVKYIKKYDSDGMFSEALNNLNKPRSPGPRPKKPNINKKGNEEKPEKFLKRQLKHDVKQQAYEKAIVKYDEAVTDIYNQLKRNEKHHSSDPDVWSMNGRNIPSDEIFPRRKISDVISTAEGEINDPGTHELMSPDDIASLKSQNQQIQSRAEKEAQINAINRRQEKMRNHNIETKQQEASRKEQQQQIEYANKGLLGKLWTNLTGHAQVKYNDDGSIANALWARNTINSAYSPVERAVKSGKIDIVQGDEAKYTKQGFISNFGNRFDVYGDVYGQAGISQSFFQSLGYDGIGDFAKNNQLIVAGAIAGAGIGTAGIASAVGNSKKNRGY